MDYKVGFCRNASGASIAYAVSGSGPPVVCCIGGHSHLEFGWNAKDHPFLGRLSERRTVVVYDKHGAGLSDRERTDFSVDADRRDLEAVVNHLGLESFDLVGGSQCGPAMISYAAMHPERIRRLVLYSTYCVFTDEQTREAVKAIAALIRSSWGLGSRVMVETSSILGQSASREEVDRLAQQERLSTSPEVAAGFVEGMLDVDVRNLLPLIQAPTLVVCRRNDQTMSPQFSQQVAAGIPGSRFVMLDGDIHDWAKGDVDALADQFVDFLDEAPAPVVEVTATTATVRTIVFTDLEGHTRLMDRLGDDRGRAVLRVHEETVRDALRLHGGAEVKSMGDGFMASFGSAQQALACACEIQQAFANPIEGEQLRVRVGVNAGEPIAEADDLFGASVIIAARIAARADGAQVLVADVVRQLVAGKGFLFSDTGEHVLKGFEEPSRIWELRWEAEA